MDGIKIKLDHPKLNRPTSLLFSNSGWYFLKKTLAHETKKGTRQFEQGGMGRLQGFFQMRLPPPGARNAEFASAYTRTFNDIQNRRRRRSKDIDM